LEIQAVTTCILQERVYKLYNPCENLTDGHYFLPFSLSSFVEGGGGGEGWDQYIYDPIIIHVLQIKYPAQLDLFCSEYV